MQTISKCALVPFFPSPARSLTLPTSIGSTDRTSTSSWFRFTSHFVNILQNARQILREPNRFEVHGNILPFSSSSHILLLTLARAQKKGVLYGLNSSNQNPTTGPREFAGAVHYPINPEQQGPGQGRGGHGRFENSTPVMSAMPLREAVSSAIQIMSPSPKVQGR